MVDWLNMAFSSVGTFLTIAAVIAIGLGLILTALVTIAYPSVVATEAVFNKLWRRRRDIRWALMAGFLLEAVALVCARGSQATWLYGLNRWAGAIGWIALAMVLLPKKLDLVWLATKWSYRWFIWILKKGNLRWV